MTCSAVSGMQVASRTVPSFQSVQAEHFGFGIHKGLHAYKQY